MYIMKDHLFQEQLMLMMTTVTVHELYGGAGDDVLIGGKGVNFFDCGDGNDIIIDFDPDKGDTQSGNCEVILNNHGDMNIFNQPNKIQSQLESFGIGSSKDEIDINDLGKTIHD